MTLAERVTEFAGGLEFDDLPADVVASVRLRTLDILGMALASSTSELAPSVLGALRGWGRRCLRSRRSPSAASELEFRKPGYLGRALSRGYERCCSAPQGDYNQIHEARVYEARGVARSADARRDPGPGSAGRDQEAAARAAPRGAGGDRSARAAAGDTAERRGPLSARWPGPARPRVHRAHVQTVRDSQVDRTLCRSARPTRAGPKATASSPSASR